MGIRMEDLDQTVAIAALIRVGGQPELEGSSWVALDHHSRAGGKHGCQCSSERRTERSRLAVWGIYEHEIVLTSVRPCVAEELLHALMQNFHAQAQRIDVAPDGGDRRRGGIDQCGVRGSSGHRLDGHGARSREQVEHDVSTHIGQDREHGLADPLGRGTGGPAAGRGQLPPAQGSADDPHAAAIITP